MNKQLLSFVKEKSHMDKVAYSDKPLPEPPLRKKPPKEPRSSSESPWGKSEEWRQKMSERQVALRDRRANEQQQEFFHQALGAQVLNWDDMQIQSYGDIEGWPRMREKILMKCPECGRIETKLMTPKLMQSSVRHLCKCCSGAIRAKNPEHLKAKDVRDRAQQSFRDAVQGPGTEVNAIVRHDIEKRLGATVTNWDELSFTRYGTPSKKGGKRQRLGFVCQSCGKDSSFTFLSIDSTPSCCASCSAIRRHASNSLP